MSREYFCAYHSMLAQMKRLTDAECGRLFRALLEYSSTGNVKTKLRDKEQIAFDIFSDQINRDVEAYEKKCKKNSANGSKGGRPSDSEKGSKSPSGKGKSADSDEEKTSPKKRKKRTVSKKANGGEKSQEKEKEEEKEKEDIFSNENIITHSDECVYTHTRTREEECDGEFASEANMAELLTSSGLSETVRERLEMWIVYKGGRCYTKVQFEMLLERTKEYVAKYGEAPVRSLIGQSISNTWKNICFEILDERAASSGASPPPASSFETDDFFSSALARTYGGSA